MKNSLFVFILCLFVGISNSTAQTHPRLFFGPSDLTAMRDRINSPEGSEMINLLKTQYETDCLSADTTDVYEKSALSVIGAFLYLIIQDENYALKSLEYAKKTMNDINEPWAATSLKGLTSYWMALSISCTYDWCYNSPNWSNEDKQSISTKLKTMADMISTNGGTEQNTNLASNWQGIRGASAILSYLVCDNVYSLTNYSGMKSKLYTFVEQNYGDAQMSSGWNIEGLGYQYYPVGNFIGPVGIALERNNREDGLKKYSSFVNSFWTVYSTLSTGIDLLGFGGLHPDFGDDNPHVSGEGVFGQSFYYLPDEMKPAAKYWYDKAAGKGRSTKKYDGYRFGLIWSYMYYPLDVVAQNPTTSNAWKTLMQDTPTGNGYYIYRNQYVNGSDELAQLYVKQRGDKGHNGPDALSFRILGTNAAWAIGGGRYGTKVSPKLNQDVYWHLMNTVYPTEPLVEKVGSPGCSNCKTNANSGNVVGIPYQDENGSGHVISEIATNNVWTTGHKRWFVADYDSLNTNCRAFYLIADSTVNGKYWQLVTAVENSISIEANTFVITSPNGSSMKATVYMAGNVTMKTGTTIRGSAYGDAMYSKYITVKGTSNNFLVTLSVVAANQVHPVPVVLQAATISDTKVTVFNKSYTFKKTNVLYNNAIPIFRPQAVWTIDKISGVAPLSVTFNGLNSFSPSNNILTYEINSGDNSITNSNILTHTYQNEGTYKASIKVTDSGNKVSERFAYILVSQGSFTRLIDKTSSHFKWFVTNKCVHLLFDDGICAFEIKCYDVTGRFLFSQKIASNHQVLDFNNYTQGVKIIRITGIHGIETFRVII